MRGTLISSDSELFFSLSNADSFAITGSDGKSTTTYLTACLLEDSYQRAIPCGNFGEALSPHLTDDDGFAYVTELSSFNLMYFKPHSKRCAITNISENHLNWHKSFDEYIDAKKNILYNSEQPIINYDCEIIRSIASDFNIFAAISTKLSEKELKEKIKAELYITLDDNHIMLCGKKHLNIADILVSGEHNIMNFCTATALSHGYCEKDSIITLAKSFGGLPHRCQLIGCYRGIKYYNSSIDSSPKRCAATLSTMKSRVILILGGRSKGLDFSELFPAVTEKAKEIIVIGECADEITEAMAENKDFCNSGIPYTVFPDFYDGIEYAHRIAKENDTVLLSPAATSYDKFRNFEQRGFEFKRIIEELETKGK
jgi:UDP-N-acetylmuramoylalanine--D-glutamate ligase